METCLVTGCAGFIGSHLAERLLSEGYSVVGIDNFSDYYPKDVKKANMKAFINDNKFRFIEGDITRVKLENILEGVDYVFHQAGTGGIRKSWGDNFKVYTESNIKATQMMLEACKNVGVKKFIYASSSSIYGDSESSPTKETATPKPISPYGVTKLAGENLCYLYWKNFNVPVISLRYFTVYGPRQRPDMAFHKFIKSVLKNEEITVYGDGSQTRDFTYVSDIVEANILSMKADVSGEAFNIGNGNDISVSDVIKTIGKLTGKDAEVKCVNKQSGDAGHTCADITKALKGLGYKPRISLDEGLKREIDWLKGVS